VGTNPSLFKHHFRKIHLDGKHSGRTLSYYSRRSLSGMFKILPVPFQQQIRCASSFNTGKFPKQIRTYALMGVAGIVGLWIVWKIGAFIVNVILLGATVWAGIRLYDYYKGGPKTLTTPNKLNPNELWKLNFAPGRVGGFVARVFPAAFVGLMSRFAPYLQELVRHGLQGGDRIPEITYKKVLRHDEVSRLLGTELLPDSDGPSAIDIDYDGDKTKGRLQFTIRGTRGVGTVRAQFSYNPDALDKKSLEDIIHYNQLIVETSTGHLVNLIKSKKPGGKDIVDADFEVLPKKK